MKDDEIEETFNSLITRLKEKVEWRKKISFLNKKENTLIF